MSANLEQQSSEGVIDNELAANRYPPVEKWNPPLSGEMDLVIQKNGEWIHEGSPIQRKELIRLFSSILKKEGDNYFLVTPVEKWQIVVEDAPLLVTAVERIVSNGVAQLIFKTMTDDTVMADRDHPIIVNTDPQSGEPSPYLMVRNGLQGRVVRSVYYQLVNWAVEKQETGDVVYGVESNEEFFKLG